MASDHMHILRSQATRMSNVSTNALDPSVLLVLEMQHPKRSWHVARA